MSYNVYASPKGGKCETGFLVKFDGKQIDLHIARISQYPFNRR